ncbi:hypothetical protein PENSPDRAFT_722501, partial [Peniophora sp. CONT]
RSPEVSPKCAPSIWTNSPYSALRSADTVEVITIDFNLDHLNIRPEPAFPAANPIIDTKNIEWIHEFSSPNCIRFDHVYIPVKKVQHPFTSRVHWTFYLVIDIGPTPYTGKNGHWIVADVITFSTGKPCISWNTRIRPTVAQCEARLARSNDKRLRPLQRVYTGPIAAFSTPYSTRKFALDPLQRLHYKAGLR